MRSSRVIRTEQLSRCDKTTATLHGQEVEITKCPPRYARALKVSTLKRKIAAVQTSEEAARAVKNKAAEDRKWKRLRKRLRKRKKYARLCQSR
jgi:hypothetical protein